MFTNFTNEWLLITDGSNKEVVKKVRIYRIQNEIGKKKGHVVATPASQLPRKNMDDLRYLYEALCRGDPIAPVSVRYVAGRSYNNYLSE